MAINDAINLMKHFNTGNIEGTKQLLSTNKIDLTYSPLCNRLCPIEHLDRHIECMKLFVNSSSFDIKNTSLLEDASRQGHSECVRLLLDKGISVRYAYIENVKDFDTAKLLVDRGYDVNKKDSFDYTRPIQRAVKNDDLKCVENLFRLGARIDIMFEYELDDYYDNNDNNGSDGNEEPTTIRIEEMTIVRYAMYKYADINIIKFLILNGGLCDISDIGFIGFMRLKGYNEEEIAEVKILIDNITDIKNPGYD